MATTVLLGHLTLLLSVNEQHRILGSLELLATFGGLLQRADVPLGKPFVVCQIPIQRRQPMSDLHVLLGLLLVQLPLRLAHPVQLLISLLGNTSHVGTMNRLQQHDVLELLHSQPGIPHKLLHVRVRRSAVLVHHLGFARVPPRLEDALVADRLRLISVARKDDTQTTKAALLVEVLGLCTKDLPQPENNLPKEAPAQHAELVQH